MKKISILETTLRDGSYAVNYSFTAAYTAELCKELENAGLRMIEIGHGVGLHGSEAGYGKAAATDEEYLTAAAGALRKAKFGMFCIPGIARLEDIDLAHKYGMGFIRIGTNVTEIERSERFIKKAKDCGMFVAANYMKSYAMSPAKFAEKTKLSERYGADMIYLVDSAGGMFMDDVVRYIKAMRKVSSCDIGFHGHDNLGLAIANSITAAEEGATYVDSSLQGLGRSSGNASTEVLVAALKKKGFTVDVDLLKLLSLGVSKVQPLLPIKGKMPLDIVSGYADFHSSYMRLIEKHAKNHGVDPHLLIMELCKVEKVNVTDQMVEKVAKRLERDHKGYLGRYGFERYVGGEQEERGKLPGEAVADILVSNWDRTFLLEGGNNYSYGQFFRAAQSIENKLKKEGAAKGEIVLFFPANEAASLAVYLAGLMNNWVISPVDPEKGDKEIKEIMSYVKQKTTIVSASLSSMEKQGEVILDNSIFPKSAGRCDEKEIRNAFAEMDAEATSLLTFTSGSTGKPKGVKNSFQNIYLAAMAFGKKFDFGSSNRFYHNLPMAYMAGILNLFWKPFLFGSSIVVGERFGIAKLARFWDLPIRHGANTFWLIPTEIALLNKLDRGNEGIAYAAKEKLTICVGTAPLNIKVKREFEKKYNTKLYESYGLSETLFVATNCPKIGANEGCVGDVLEGVDLKIYADGELGIRVPWMFLGYSNATTDECMEGDYFFSGDIGEIGTDGLLKITGRKKDLVIRGGVNISPKKLEDFISSRDIFSECAIIGAPDQNLGEKTVCMYVKDSGYSEDGKKTLLHEILEELGQDYRVDEFVEVKEIPKNINGKVDKPELRRIYATKKGQQ